MTANAGTSDNMRLDGNAAAGLLSEIFARDVTVARATCAGCGRADSIGGLHLSAQDMGAVLRCPGCTAVVVRATLEPWRPRHKVARAVRATTA